MSLSLGNIWTQKRVKTASSISHIGLNNIMTVRQAEKSNPELGTKRYWGNATWFLFHTIAARINPEYYKNNVNMIWNFISECCGNLPCPFCRAHATAHLKTISIHQINTRAKLEKVFFDFHNIVNRRLRKRLFKQNELEKYKRANLRNIFINFEHKYFRAYFGTREFSGWLRNGFRDKYNKFRLETGSHYI